MTDAVEVRCAKSARGWTCRVMVGGPGAPTVHEVAVTAADLVRLAPLAADPVDLVARSFEFLLAREPRTSILRAFELTMIGRYFPEFEGAILRRR
jgi:hypothetical protein